MSALLIGCGDVGPVHAPVDAFSTLVESTLASADLRFAQCERVYSDKGALQVHSGGEHSRVAPELASVFENCGFDVVSVASNHAMDWGGEALVDSIEGLRRRGIRTVGAGRDLAEAREPAVVTVSGVRVGFLAYCSVVRDGYAAGPNRPGVAPMRAHTYYRPIEYQPGIPPKVVTVPDDDDLAAMLDDIARVRPKVDVLVLSLHWGIHFIPRMIADYQRIVAKAALGAGVDLLLGHHAHVPKAIAMYDRKACFYSLSNFIMSTPPRTGDKARQFAERYGVTLDPEYPHLPYGTDGTRSMIARATLSTTGVDTAAFQPVMIDKQLRPEVLCPSDPRFPEALDYLEWASEGFPHQFQVVGDEVVLAP